MPRVLVVEDDPSQRSLIGAILGDEGHEVCMVGSISAIADHRDELEPHDHDLLITDMRLADRTISMAEVKDLGSREGVPVLVVSGSRDGAADARAEGIAFISKPYEIDDLVAAVRRLIPAS